MERPDEWAGRKMDDITPQEFAAAIVQRQQRAIERAPFAGGGEVVLGGGANVGHGAVLHGCRLGKYVLVGMNAVVMDGADVGDYAFIGALAMVKANFTVPPRSIAVGVPAKILRELTDEEISWKRDGDEDYQSLIRRCQATMKRVQPLTEIDNIDEPRIKIDGIPALYKTRE